MASRAWKDGTVTTPQQSFMLSAPHASPQLFFDASDNLSRVGLYSPGEFCKSTSSWI